MYSIESLVGGPSGHLYSLSVQTGFRAILRHMNIWTHAAVTLPFMVLLALTGCATSEIHAKRSVYGAIALPPDAEVIGLTVARPCPGFSLELPVGKGSASQSAAREGAKAMLADPHGAVLFPLGYAVGGIVGGILGVDPDELKVATQTIRAAAQGFHFDERLSWAIKEHVNASHPGRIRDLEDNIPMEHGAVQGLLRRHAGGRLAWIKPSPAPHPLAGTQVDTVIGIRVAFQGFQARPNPNVSSTGDVELFNPPLALVLLADVTVVRVGDWVDLGGLTVSYESVPRKFTDWAAENAQAFRRESEAGLQQLLDLVTSRIDGNRQPPNPL